VTVCFGVCCRSLVSQVLRKGCREMEITGPLTAKQGYDWLRCCSWEVVDSHSDFPLLGPLRNTWSASDLQKTSTWSKLSPHGCRNMTPIFFPTPGYKRCCHGGQMRKCRWQLCRSDAYSLLPMCQACVGVSMKFVASMSVTSFFVTCLYLNRNALNFSS